VVAVYNLCVHNRLLSLLNLLSVPPTSVDAEQLGCSKIRSHLNDDTLFPKIILSKMIFDKIILGNAV